MNTLLWFQRNLRISDNPALNWALQQGKPIIAIYIHSPKEDTRWSKGSASRWWLHQSLNKLSVDLIKFDIKLQFFKDDFVTKISQLIKKYPIDSVMWTNRYESHRIKCESIIELELLTTKDAFTSRHRIPCHVILKKHYKKTTLKPRTKTHSCN